MFYFATASGIYGYDMNTCTSQLVVDFQNSDFIYSDVFLLRKAAGGFVCCAYDLNSQYNIHVTYLQKLAENNVVEKYAITIGGVFLDDTDLMKAVVEFNQSNTEYRIVVKDYAAFAETNNERYNLLISDIKSGNSPDILFNPSFDKDRMNTGEDKILINEAASIFGGEFIDELIYVVETTPFKDKCREFVAIFFK